MVNEADSWMALLESSLIEAGVSLSSTVANRRAGPREP